MMMVGGGGGEMFPRDERGINILLFMSAQSRQSQNTKRIYSALSAKTSLSSTATRAGEKAAVSSWLEADAWDPLPLLKQKPDAPE